MSIENPETNKYKLTDRSLNAYENLLGDIDLSSIVPKGGVVLNIGSGINKKFEKQFSIIRPDIKFISIDPTLSLKNEKGIEIHETNEDSCVYLQNYKEDSKKYIRKLSDVEKNKHWEKRIKSTSEMNGSVAMLAPDLGIRDSSVDVALDLIAAFRYLSDKQSRKLYLSEISRILKPGGKAYIYFHSNGNSEKIEDDKIEGINIIINKYGERNIAEINKN